VADTLLSDTLRYSAGRYSAGRYSACRETVDVACGGTGTRASG
jgi:hypothetical protein